MRPKREATAVKSMDEVKPVYRNALTPLARLVPARKAKRVIL
jgi:hypothetical protein